MEIQHLKPEQIAVAAEYQSAGKYTQLSNEIKSHLADCNECAKEVLLIGDIHREEHNKRTKRRHLSIGLISAAAAAILIFLTTTFIIPEDPIAKPNIAALEKVTKESKKENAETTQNQKKEATIKQQNIETTKTNSPKSETLIAYYKPNKKLEKLAHRFDDSNMRSKGTKSFPTEIDLQKKQTISLEKSNELFLIEIYDNKGKLVHELNSKNDSIHFPELSKGLFYWKLINEDFDLIFVGKLKR